MPKVLRILNRLNVGGPTYNVAYLSKYLSPDYQTEVLAGFNEPYEASSAYVLDDLNVGYHYVPHMHRKINPVNDYRAFSYIKENIEIFKPDIVHTHAAKAGAVGRLAAHYAKHKPKAIVHTYHGNVFDGYFSPLKTKIILSLEKYLCSISNAIVAISETQKQDLVNKYKIAPEEKIHVIPLGFDLAKFYVERDLKRKKFRQEFCLEESTIVISIIGRIAPVKNHELFISAINYVLKLKGSLKIKAFIVGDGEQLQEIIKLLKQHSITYCLSNEKNFGADVIFTSWRKDIDVINAGSDIIALTSLNEGTPVSIIEALASGKAVISTNVGGVGDVIKNNITGILCSLNELEFGQKLNELINKPLLRKELGLKGEETVKKYTYERLVADTKQLYDALLHLSK